MSAGSWTLDGASSTAGAPQEQRTPPSASLPRGGALWTSQIRAMVALELRKALFGRRSLPMYVIAALPVLVMLVPIVVRRPGGDPLFENVGQARTVFSYVFHSLILPVVFAGCVGVFTNLFRGEVLDRSLHYLLLTPVRRDVLTLGKYLAGLARTSVLFGVSVVVSYLLLHLPLGISRTGVDLMNGGLVQLAQYSLVTVLACLGYGSLFLVLGVVFKNPILPALALFSWEILNFLLPPMLKRISVIHYLKGLVPVPLSEGPIAVVADPPPAIVSILGLLVLSVVAVAVAGLLVRRMEIRYGED